MPGTFAYLVLALWLPFSLVAFFVWRPAKALVLVLVGGMLFLPEVVSFDAPLVPPLGKYEVSALCALIGCLCFAPSRLRQVRLSRGFDLILVALVLSVVPCVLDNMGPVARNPRAHVLSFHDIPALMIRDILRIGIPFYLGRAVLNTSRDLEMLLRTVVGLALVYSVLMLFEMRFSPNLHRWVFGYHAHPDFTQTMRWGGWRPTVFLEHGLAVGLFALVAAVLAAAEARCTRVRWALPSTVWLGYLALVLVLCRSTGAIALGVLLVPVAYLASTRWQMRVAQALGVACIVFPLLQIAGLFPDQPIVNAVRAVAGEERAASLGFRFAADVQLIDHARTKLWLGWGGWDRRMVWDPSTWRYIVSDGYWIIQLGARGVLGLGCVLALLLGPIFLCARRLGRIQDPPDRLRLGALALAVAAFSFDLLLNGMFVTIPFFYAGALYGVTRALTLAPQGFSVQEFPEWPEVAPRSPSSS